MQKTQNASSFLFHQFFLSVYKNGKSNSTSVFSFFLILFKKTGKSNSTSVFRFFPFCTRNEKKQFYFRFFVFSFANKKREKQLLYKYSPPVFPVLRERKWRREERGWVEVRMRSGVGGGAGRRQRNVTTTSFNKHNNNRFLKQLKSKTATTNEISLQRLKISDNKIRESWGKSLQTPTTKVCATAKI